MIGHTVVITKTDGSVLEGVFHTYCPFENVKNDGKNVYVVKGVRLVSAAAAATNNSTSSAATTTSANNAKGDFQEGSTLLLSSSQVMKLHIKSIRLDTTTANTNSTNAGNDIRTDAEISGQKGGNEKLIAAGSVWISAGDAPNNLGGALEGSTRGGMNDGNSNSSRGGMFKSTWSSNKSQQSLNTASTTNQGLSGTIGDWDQFTANERKFNVKASFDENLYTTSLDYAALDKRKLAEAERIAQEIESQVSSNIHVMEERGHKIEGDYDEEDLYSGVLKKKDVEGLSLKKEKQQKQQQQQQQKVNADNDVVDGVDKDEKNEIDSASDGGGMNYAAAAGGKKETKSDNTLVEVKQSNKEEEKNAKKEEDAKKLNPENNSEEESKPKLNPNAKEFTFNPSAKSFTPSFTPSAPAAAQQNIALPVSNSNVEYALGGGGGGMHPGMPMGSYHHPGGMQYMQPGENMSLSSSCLFTLFFIPLIIISDTLENPNSTGMMPVMNAQHPQMPYSPYAMPPPPVVSGSGGGQEETSSASGEGSIPSSSEQPQQQQQQQPYMQPGYAGSYPGYYGAAAMMHANRPAFLPMQVMPGYPQRMYPAMGMPGAGGGGGMHHRPPGPYYGGPVPYPSQQGYNDDGMGHNKSYQRKNSKGGGGNNNGYKKRGSNGGGGRGGRGYYVEGRQSEDNSTNDGMNQEDVEQQQHEEEEHVEKAEAATS